MAARQAHATAQSRLESLEELDRSLEGFDAGVKAILSDSDDAFEADELQDVIARMISVEPDYEQALAAALGESLQWVATRDFASAIKAVRLLEDREAGRAGFLAVGASEAGDGSEAPDGTHPLLDHVTAPAGLQGVMDRLLAVTNWQLVSL